MPSLLRRLLSGHGAKGRTLQLEGEAEENVAVEEPPSAQALDREPPAEQAAPPAGKPAAKIEAHPFSDERELIPADQLPSAAAVFAELFPPEQGGDPLLNESIENRIEDSPAYLGEMSINLTEAAPAERIPDRESENVENPAAAAEAVAMEMEKAAIFGEQENVHPEHLGATTKPRIAPAMKAIGEQPDQPVAPAIDAIAEKREETMLPALVANDHEAVAADAAVEMPGAAAPKKNREAEDAEIAKAASIAQLESPAASGRDWKLEEKLASHLEWLDTRGKSGLRADLSDANLEGQELIGVKLSFADLHDVNLRAADLLLADMRDASLVRADLEDSCLVGANLEAANLEGASLETAMGLVPHQIAGANLRDALLPPQIMEFEAASKFARASRIAWRCFVPLIPVVLISWLIIWKTKDAQLLTDSAVIPYVHSRSAAAAMPTEQIFLLAPLMIFSLYLVFHFQLQKVWQAVVELPAIFPDGHSLDDRGPGLLIGLLRAHFWWIGREATSTMWVEKTFSVVAAYWIAPFTLILFWARYLTMQDAKGTLLQALLAAVATGVALHATLKSGRAQEQWTERKWTARVFDPLQKISPAVSASALGVTLLLLSIGTMIGVPHDRSRAPQYSAASIRRWAPDVLWAFGFDPYADLTEATLSRKPNGWTGANTQVSQVAGPQLNETTFRYARAYGVSLVNAHLWQSDFEGAYLSEADFRGADLGSSDLRRTILDGAQLSGTNLHRAQLDGAVLARADLRWANLSYSSLANAVLVDSRLDGATLYDARLTSASLARSGLEKVDLRGAYLNSADLDHADLQRALLWSAKLPGANLYGAKLQGAVAIDADLRGVDLREAQFAGTVLSDANLSGANLDGADLRGALELKAWQVCASKSRRGALLDDALAMQISTECGGLQ